jgi:hypothetical protein
MAKKKTKQDKLNEEFERFISIPKYSPCGEAAKGLALDAFLAGYNFSAKQIKPTLNEYKKLKKLHDMAMAWAKHTLDTMPKYQEPDPQ